MRRATIEDCELLFRWRRDDEQAGWWEGISAESETHQQWLEERLASPAVVLLVAEVDGVPVGQARIDSNGELSFSIGEDHRGNGYGTLLVVAAVQAAYEAGHTRVKACADASNDGGIRTMQKAGFKLRPDVVFLRHPR